MFAGEFRFADELEKENFIDPSEVRAVSHAVKAAIARPVLGVTKVEGREESLRVHFTAGSLIATRRNNLAELKREAHKLNKLWKAGAPVPRFIAMNNGFLMEEDLGGRSLTSVLAYAYGRRRHRLMEAAFTGLYKVKAVARRANFKKPPPLFRHNPNWLKHFVGSPRRLSEFLGIEPPPIDEHAIRKVLDMPASHFVKWGASPCNAHVCSEGSVSWFDWRTAGLSAGYEDVGFLISDENWPFEPSASLALYRRFQSDWTPHTEADLCVFAALRTCHRLLSLGKENREDVSLQVVRRLVAHGVAFAGRSVLLREAEPWFRSLGTERVWGQKYRLQPGLLGAGSSGDT